MKKDNQKGQEGFTLMELLVVVVVIGILTAVILASINTSRSKGSDAAAKRDLSTIRTQANLYYTNAGAGTYGTVTAACNAGMYSADTTIAAAVAHATTNSSLISCSVGPTNQTFGVAVKLKNAGYYCVDSANTGKVNTTASNIYGSGGTFALDSVTGLCN